MGWLNEHCAREGRPEQASVTGAAKLPIGVRVTVVFTVCPSATASGKSLLFKMIGDVLKVPSPLPMNTPIVVWDASMSVMTISSLPSLLKSPTATFWNEVLTIVCTMGGLKARSPLPSRTEILPNPTVMRSRFPSPLKSPTAMLSGLAGREFAGSIKPNPYEPKPERIEIRGAASRMAMSGFPSLLKSAAMTERGVAVVPAEKKLMEIELPSLPA